MTELDPKALRRAFGSFMTGVTIVTALDDDGTPVGFTANSFSSVSLDPPLLLVCPAKSLSSFEIFEKCEHFHVSVLAYDQQAASNTFASNNDDRFSQIDWQSDCHGCPKIIGAIASFSCQRDRSIDAGDHIILLGKVIEFESQDKQGLGYGVGGYFSLNMERAATELQTATHNDAKQLVAGALVEHQGTLLLLPGNVLPEIEIADEQPTFDAIHSHLENLLQVPIEVGSVFSVFDHENQPRSSIYYRVRISSDFSPQTGTGSFYKMDQLDELDFSSATTASIVSRYAAEYRSGNHRIYVGTDAAGKTHKITTGPS